MAKQDVQNVVVFGETGAGKSSVINMIVGRQVAETSSRATGCTFQSKPYSVDLGGMSVTLWDTAGLNEGEVGTVAAKDAIVNLYKLLRSLENGLSLLLYCVRGRIKASTVKNYRMFYHGLCQKNIPIVLVVTGLELENSMDTWWTENKGEFEKQQMYFSDHACITATKGKLGPSGFTFEREYEASKVKVVKLIRDRCRHAPWKMKTSLWMISTVKNAFNFWTRMFNIQPLVLSRILYEVLLEHAGLSSSEARKLANAAENSVNQKSGQSNVHDGNHSSGDQHAIFGRIVTNEAESPDSMYPFTSTPQSYSSGTLGDSSLATREAVPRSFESSEGTEHGGTKETGGTNLRKDGGPRTVAGRVRKMLGRGNGLRVRDIN